MHMFSAEECRLLDGKPSRQQNTRVSHFAYVLAATHTERTRNGNSMLGGKKNLFLKVHAFAPPGEHPPKDKRHRRQLRHIFSVQCQLRIYCSAAKTLA
jgi:hypothetical protein